MKTSRRGVIACMIISVFLLIWWVKSLPSKSESARHDPVPAVESGKHGTKKTSSDNIVPLSNEFISAEAVKVSTQGSVPSVSEVLSKVREATLPKTGLTVQVRQSIIKSSKSPATGVTTNITGEVDKVIEMTVDLNGQGFHSRPYHSSTTNSSGQTTSPGQSQTQQARTEVVMNPVQSLQDMLSWQDVQVESIAYQGQPCLKLSGTGTGPLSGVVIVDREKWCVYSITVNMRGRKVIDGAAKYMQHRSGIWLPSSVVIVYPTEGVRIEQEFGEFSGT